MIDVLVLDDDLMLRLTVAEALRGEGYRVEEAGSLRQARRVLSMDACTILIADHDLGEPDGIDGFSFAQAVRQERPSLGVIYMTARVEHLDTLPPGEVTLRKPFTLATLVHRTRAMTAQRADPLDVVKSRAR